jgi:hypothetical protein
MHEEKKKNKKKTRLYSLSTVLNNIYEEVNHKYKLNT